MQLWTNWLSVVKQLRPAFSRKTTFMWMIVVLIGFTIKFDSNGVTSFVRAVGLNSNHYLSLLNFFRSRAINLKLLQLTWVSIALKRFEKHLEIVNGRLVLLGDGIKIAKEGRKMPCVKWLHQESESNSKATFIMGHSLQVVALLVKAFGSHLAVPLGGEIHEGFKTTKTAALTLLDKLFTMVMSFGIDRPCYLVLDKYYASGRLIKQFVGAGHHIVTSMKKNAVAYLPLQQPSDKKTGRPKKYGEKIKLFSLFDDLSKFKPIESRVEPGVMLQFYCIDLFWRPLGEHVKFVCVIHPTKGMAIYMSSDLTVSPEDLIYLYSLRFKIEVTFKQAVHQVGVFTYHFWLRNILPTKRGQKNKFIQFEEPLIKQKFMKKIRTYHIYILLGFIAQGLMHYMAIFYKDGIWAKFGTWMRTMRKDLAPSEKVVSLAMERCFLEFLTDDSKPCIFKKFLLARADLSQLRGFGFKKKKAA